MPPTLALMIGVAFIVVLLRIERKENQSASIALWIPTSWILYCGSRPIGAWFPYRMADIEAGSPYDRMVLGALIFIAIYVIKKSKIEWAPILRENSLLVLLFIFTGLSILWSDFPFLSIKRWVRLAGIIPISIVVLSEKKPIQAIESILRRCAYVLLPLSIILIKYFPHYGREYGRWVGQEMWLGVTLTKNMLGQLCAFSALFFIWMFFRELLGKHSSRGRFCKITDGLLLTIAIYLLVGSNSVTSYVVLLVGVPIMLLLYFVKNSARRIATLIIFGVVLTWVLLIAGGSIVREATQALGRDPTFTARMDFWPMLLKEGASRPIFGAGYGGYFNTPGNTFSEAYGMHWAHNGLLMAFVELGILGVLLVLAFYIGLFNLFGKTLNTYFDLSVFGICLLVMSWLVAFSENLFLVSSSFPWSITIICAIVSSRSKSNTCENEASG